MQTEGVCQELQKIEGQTLSYDCERQIRLWIRRCGWTNFSEAFECTNPHWGAAKEARWRWFEGVCEVFLNEMSLFLDARGLLVIREESELILEWYTKFCKMMIRFSFDNVGNIIK